MDEEAKEDPVIEIVRRVHSGMLAQRKPQHPHDVIVTEAAEVTKYLAPEVDPEQFRVIQIKYLRQKDALIASGMKEQKLADRLDDLARKTQKDIAKKIGREQYQTLMGVSADEQLGLVEPDAVGAAGVPVPPDEVSRVAESESEQPEPTQE